MPFCSTVSCVLHIPHCSPHPSDVRVNPQSRAASLHSRAVPTRYNTMSSATTDRREYATRATSVDGPGSSRAPLFRFGAIADVQYADIPDGKSFKGVPRYYRNTLNILQRAVQEWTEKGVDFVIHYGDIVDGFNPKDQSSAALTRVLDIFDQLGRPHYHMLGNHCLYNLPRHELNRRLNITNTDATEPEGALVPAVRWFFSQHFISFSMAIHIHTYIYICIYSTWTDVLQYPARRRVPSFTCPPRRLPRRRFVLRLFPAPLVALRDPRRVRHQPPGLARGPRKARGGPRPPPRA